MTEISDVDIYTSPRFPKTFVKLYRNVKDNELIITLSKNEGAGFALPEGTVPISEEINTGDPEPIKIPETPWKFDKEKDRWVRIIK